MNDIIGNTPIFDQLARERSYDRLVARGDTSLQPVFKYAAVSLADRTSSFMSPGLWIAKPVPHMNPEQVELKETVNPEEAEEEYGCFQKFIDHEVEEFTKRYPNAGEVSVTTTPQVIDGSITVIVSGIDPGVADEPFDKVRLRFFGDKIGDEEQIRTKSGVLLQKRFLDPPDVAEVSTIGEIFKDVVEDATRTFYEAHPNAVITNMTPKKNPDGTVTMGIEAVEPKIDGHTPEGLAKQQLELYRKMAISPVIPVEPQQTDEFVNAAYGINSTPKTNVPRPLWISDEEIRDEE